MEFLHTILFNRATLDIFATVTEGLAIEKSRKYPNFSGISMNLLQTLITETINFYGSIFTTIDEKVNGVKQFQYRTIFSGKIKDMHSAYWRNHLGVKRKLGCFQVCTTYGNVVRNMMMFGLFEFFKTIGLIGKT